MVTAFVVLQDTNLTNGGLRTITGSHKWGLIPDSATFFEKDLDRLHDQFAKFAAKAGVEWEDEGCLMKAGQVAFHHSLTFHGSGANMTEQDRLALAIHMQSDECYYQPGKWHSNIREIGPLAVAGDPFVGPSFPVLYSEKEKGKAP